MMEAKENDKIMILENIPSEWKIKKMDEFADIKIGGTPARKESKYWENGIHPWVSISDVSKSNKYLFNTKEKITDEGVQHSNVKLIPKNSVLMTFKLTLGKLVITSKSVYTNEAIAAILPNNPDHLITDYLYYALSNVDYEKFIDNAVKGKTLNKSKLSNIKMLIPPLKEQQKIAEILSTVDKQIEQTDQLIEKKKELKKGLMQQLLTKGIGHNEFKQSELGEVAINWKISTFKNYTRINQGLQIAIEERFKESGVNRHVYITNQFLKESGDRFFIENPQISVICNEEDILMTRTGNTGIVVTNVSGVFHNNFFRVAYNKEKLIKDFLVYYLRSEKIQKIIKKYAASTTIPDLKHSDFYKIIIVVPPLEEQQKIADILSSVDEDMEGYVQEKSKYEELKKGLMQQLLTGKTRVKVD